jgi:hypothetical protein
VAGLGSLCNQPPIRIVTGGDRSSPVDVFNRRRYRGVQHDHDGNGGGEDSQRVHARGLKPFLQRPAGMAGRCRTASRVSCTPVALRSSPAGMPGAASDADAARVR